MRYTLVCVAAPLRVPLHKPSENAVPHAAASRCKVECNPKKIAPSGNPAIYWRRIVAIASRVITRFKGFCRGTADTNFELVPKGCMMPQVL
ncbi:hypothetical protein MiSe_72850 [Microseira wollei NIES-4236]|uniref:Transposase n=1 Tax=Microseira wollei NIES-4236 TaxID=2530354 RepID=A0AAV3XJJ0_9CYAN|nr:hypothetical protein MiSe_72850 [Microseira wollei NIES-4236]